VASELSIDPIQYTDSFRKNVNGRLRARFKLDSEGRPIHLRGGRLDPRFRHYEINLFLDSPSNDRVSRVLYYIDDPTFEDKEASSKDRDSCFVAEIQTYGDVPIKVTVIIDGSKILQEAWLSQMLINGHAGDMKPAIKNAIERIKLN
jgi:hypothetical protein